MEKYNITLPNIHNFDEKGFLLGLSRSQRRIVTREALKRRRLLGASQDGSREFLSLVASICADGSHLPPALIYQGKSHDLQDTWLEDFDHSKELAFFASTERGWSDGKLGLHWLQRVFDHYTKEKAGRGRRLLIVDGHNSHVNLAFIDYADQNRIIISVLPPHSTHRLQPLDVGLFSPLSTYYSQEINDLLAKSMGLTSMTKRLFWNMFRPAWECAFTAKNILAAWEATGIQPFNPGKVIKMITRPEPATPQQVRNWNIRKTPKSADALIRAFNDLKEGGHVDMEAFPLLRAGVKLAAELKIKQVEIDGLRETVIIEKKKRKRGKAMGMHEEGESPNQPMFFSPARVERARQRAAEAEQAEQLRKQNTEDRRIRAATARAEKAREAAERRAARIAAKEERDRVRAAKKAEQEAKRGARKAERLEKASRKMEMAANKKTNRSAATQSKERVAGPKKRPFDEEGEATSRKRACVKPSKRRDNQHTDNSAIGPVAQVNGLEDSVLSAAILPQPTVRRRNTCEAPVFRLSRTGRSINVPARYQ